MTAFKTAELEALIDCRTPALRRSIDMRSDSGRILRYANGMLGAELSEMTWNQPEIPSRHPTAGPEYTLMVHFCDNRLAPSRPGETVSIFVEPKIDGAFPDLVAVYWNRDVAAKWPEPRSNLTTTEIKHLHLLHHLGSIAVSELRTRLGTRSADSVVERMVQARVVDYKNGELRKRALAEIFAVRRLVAIEAKISDWRAGLRQAFLNSWFASESFLLLPAVSEQEGMFARARELGIGIVSGDQDLLNPAVRSKCERIPKSYASWLFNEWAWRHTRCAST